MQGKILVYSADVNAGIITGEDGERYPFNLVHWQSKDKLPANDMLVTFSPNGNYAESVTAA